MDGAEQIGDALLVPVVPASLCSSFLNQPWTLPVLSCRDGSCTHLWVGAQLNLRLLALQVVAGSLAPS